MFGLLCSAAGCPLAVEVFPGNTADPTTLWDRKWSGSASASASPASRWSATAACSPRPVSARISPRLGWTGSPPSRLQHLRKLAGKRPKPAPGQDPAAVKAPLRPAQLVPDQVAAIRSPDFPGERLLVCLNPRLRAERARKREALLRATEHILAGIAAQVRRGRELLRGRDAINRRLRPRTATARR